jgi:hypothetical protein
MPEVLSPELIDPASLMQLVAVNSDYEMEADADVALTKARRVWAGCERLLILAPTEMQQGGVGRGSGFSAVFDTKQWVDMRNRARAFVETQAPQRAATGSRMFGVFSAETRFFHCVPED